jgi:hypothetical protein
MGAPVDWELLKYQRWGPAVGDPTPGIEVEMVGYPDWPESWVPIYHARVAELVADGLGLDAADRQAFDELDALTGRPTRLDPTQHTRPAALAGWPDDRRERWGLRANELELAGVPWREAERQAFAEVASEVRPSAPASKPASRPESTRLLPNLKGRP